MDIILIGSGNVATVLGRRSRDAGHRILQVYGRNQVTVRSLAANLDAVPVEKISELEKSVDLILIALRDEAVSSFIGDLGSSQAMLVHTAGALSIDLLKSASNAYGVLYPLQSLRKEIQTIPPITLLVDGNQPQTRGILREFGASIAETVLDASDEIRLNYHLAATLVNNFTNYLYILAASFCKEEKIMFSALQPLMEETVNRLRTISPSQSQTGPAWRNDLITLEKHRQVLKDFPAISKLYDLFTEEIQRFASSGQGEGKTSLGKV
jgi:predicted short-subunit dehydrogenase-like oxidoreductase (DUF2520 family)